MQNINFGEVHLNVTNIEESVRFWTDIVGMKINRSGETTEVGTSSRTLLVLHPGAKISKQKGFSGLYHIAIHVETEAELAHLFLRLNSKGWPMAPTDHVVAKSLYVDDPDNINIEFSVETPQRIAKELITENNFMVEDNKGHLRHPIEQLNINELVMTANDKKDDLPFPKSAIIGHMNLHQPELIDSYDFYKKLDFIPHVLISGQNWGDLGAGGISTHRIAVNLWAGLNAPPTPEYMAGLKYFTLKYDTKQQIQKVLAHFPKTEKNEKGYFLKDPGGNKILILNGTTKDTG
jgi:catechol 2,3-dioxygenase